MALSKGIWHLINLKNIEREVKKLPADILPMPNVSVGPNGLSHYADGRKAKSAILLPLLYCII